uniref:MULE transposase domain-containing protein n=1 Tax=Chenopodium quinoa TaxID=63459 RepID=A0A803N0W6_CHEQI
MRNLAQSAGGTHEVGFLKKDLYNTCEKFKREEIKDGDTEIVLPYLLGKTASDPSFFLRYTRDDHDGIDKMFWCDGICQADYKAFGKVIEFDTTYKVNAYQKPFVVVVGVNHYRKTVPLGVALIGTKKPDTYIWVLEPLNEAGGNVTPYIVVTNGDKAMAIAIEEVFPHVHHRLCLWHLMCNIKGHTNKRFCSSFMKCVDGARTPAEFEEAWEDLIKAYDAVRDKKWAQDLYNNKEKRADAFMVGQFYVVMKFKGMVEIPVGCILCRWTIRAEQETKPSPVKSGGFVELLRNCLPRTYNIGDATNATDCYEVSAFEKFPTIFDWDPNTDF